MHSSTTSYIALQNLYKAQAVEDGERFREILAGVLEKAGVEREGVTEEEIDGFVRNAGGVGIIKGRPLKDAKELKGLSAEVIGELRSVWDIRH
jgi:amyloid beta precursor protein binding protein 1